MSEENPSDRQRVLEMLEKGTITAGEAARLINALNGKTAKPKADLQDNASPKIRGIDAALSGLNSHNASPSVTAGFRWQPEMWPIA